MAISAGSKILASDIANFGNSGGLLYYWGVPQSTQRDLISTQISNSGSNTREDYLTDTTATLNSYVWNTNEITYPNSTHIKFTTAHSSMIFILQYELVAKNEPGTPRIKYQINDGAWIDEGVGWSTYSESMVWVTRGTIIHIHHSSSSSGLKGKTFKMITSWSAGNRNNVSFKSYIEPISLAIIGIGTKYT